MDIWEANARSNQIAPHPCNETGVYLCEGDECGATGVCDKNGCGWNPYRLNETDYYGEGASFDVDTTKPFTVVTQFPADSEGKLIGITRLYVQGGAVIKSETVAKAGLPAVDSITDDYCVASGATKFTSLGALEVMGDALTRGMVVAMSIWWDAGGSMLWLDAASQSAGPCTDAEGSPANIVLVEPSPEVTFTNLKWGEIGSTYQSTPTNSTGNATARYTLGKKHWKQFW
jgi:cellulase